MPEWEEEERNDGLAPRSPLHLCLLQPVFLDYYLNPKGNMIYLSTPSDSCKWALLVLNLRKTHNDAISLLRGEAGVRRCQSATRILLEKIFPAEAIGPCLN